MTYLLPYATRDGRCLHFRSVCASVCIFISRATLTVAVVVKTCRTTWTLKNWFAGKTSSGNKVCLWVSSLLSHA